MLVIITEKIYARIPCHYVPCDAHCPTDSFHPGLLSSPFDRPMGSPVTNQSPTQTLPGLLGHIKVKKEVLDHHHDSCKGKFTEKFSLLLSGCVGCFDFWTKGGDFLFIYCLLCFVCFWCDLFAVVIYRENWWCWLLLVSMNYAFVIKKLYAIDIIRPRECLYKNNFRLHINYS